MVVREDLSVVCYDHELRRLWNKELKHEALPGDFASYVMDQVSSLLPVVRGCPAPAPCLGVLVLSPPLLGRL